MPEACHYILAYSAEILVLLHIGKSVEIKING